MNSMSILKFGALLAAISLSLAAQTATDRDIIRTQLIPESKIVRKVQPVYPANAADLHIEGTVKIAVVIAKDGHIENLRLISGHPLLAPAALQAVRQWKFE